MLAETGQLKIMRMSGPSLLTLASAGRSGSTAKVGGSGSVSPGRGSTTRILLSLGHP